MILDQTAIHRIAQPTLHKFGVRHLDVQRRLELRHAARESEVTERRRAPIASAPEKLVGGPRATLKRWHKGHGMPLVRISHGGIYYALWSEVEAWARQRAAATLPASKESL